MARDPTLTREALIGLGAGRLAELALDEAKTSAAFRNLLTDAIAATEGPAAVAAIVDKRLAALERGRGAIGAGRVRGFAEELAAILKTIAGDLARADPTLAVERMLRFLATADRTLDRVGGDDSDVEAVYREAASALPALLRGLASAEAAPLAEALYALCAGSHSAILLESAEDILAAAPAEAVAALDGRLAESARALGPIDPATPDWSVRARLRRLIELRQRIADARGDVDAYIALETSLPSGSPDLAAIGERLIEAGRAREALDWLRRPAPGSIKMMTMDDLHAGLPPRDFAADLRMRLEVRALEALGEREAARALRWRLFTERLDPALLREHIARLPDFEDVEALDEAFAAALASPLIAAALRFFVLWPRLDLAERLIVEKRKQWDGERYRTLAPAAEALEGKHPLGAVILYRVLLDSILERGQSAAYDHAARYYLALERLETREAPGSPIEPHRHYRAELRRRHGRKFGFWSRIETSRQRG